MPMALQVFMPCYFGNEVLIASQNLSNEIFNVAWYERDGKFHRSFKIFIENTKIPIKIVCGKIFMANLETFVSICQTTYRFYALLQSLN
jgi:hypothetical protein